WSLAPRRRSWSPPRQGRCITGGTIRRTGEHPQRPLLHRRIDLLGHVLILLDSEGCAIKPVTLQHWGMPRASTTTLRCERASSRASHTGRPIESRNVPQTVAGLGATPWPDLAVWRPSSR